MELTGVLQNASKVGWKHRYNDLHTASFSLPPEDPKADLCQTHCIVDIFDGDESRGKFRILSNPKRAITSDGTFEQYTCEHVIAFLMDDRIDGYLETGGTDCKTRAVLEQLLALQSVKRWKLGRCDFDRQFQYSWENASLLDAFFSVPNCFDVPYHWEYDTSTYPWTVNLISPAATRNCEIRYKRNSQEISREVDGTALCTRLYCKGYGEGVNQLTISSVNNGLPYLDADTKSIYGVVARHFIDHRFTNPETLMARGQAILDETKRPRYIYTAKAVDLSRITGDSWDFCDEGKYCHVIDEKDHVDFDSWVISAGKDDVDGDPLNMDIEISNKSSDVATDLENIAKRTAINEQYSQGATNLYSQQYYDNADETHPATMRVYIPTGCKQINQILLSWQFAEFRAYSTGAEAGGGSSSTSSDGGGGTHTSTAGGAESVTTPTKSTQNRWSGSTAYAQNASGTMTQTGASDGDTGFTQPGCTPAGEHNHSIDSHTHSFSGDDSVANGHTHTVTVNSLGTKTTTTGVSTNSSHNISISGTTGGKSLTTNDNGSHYHTITNHQHSIGSHTHFMSHTHKLDFTISVTIPELTIEIPSHSHSVTIPAHSHSVTIPAHSHAILYGIYEGGKATAATLKIDGTEIPAEDVSSNEMDIVDYLSKDGSGKITRGTWHTVEIIPNALTRIEANLFVQTFVTSYTGGDY